MYLLQSMFRLLEKIKQIHTHLSSKYTEICVSEIVDINNLKTYKINYSNQSQFHSFRFFNSGWLVAACEIVTKRLDWFVLIK